MIIGVVMVMIVVVIMVIMMFVTAVRAFIHPAVRVIAVSASSGVRLITRPIITSGTLRKILIIIPVISLRKIITPVHITGIWPAVRSTGLGSSDVFVSNFFFRHQLFPPLLNLLIICQMFLLFMRKKSPAMHRALF
jgi:hypothetical protein